MLEGRHRFDTFVIGAANRLAAAAARAVAEAPGAAYNPLFIHSAPGLGKTHLLGAISHLARQLHPGLAVAYLTLDEFVAQLDQAIATGQAEAFKRRHAGVGLLLLDDVQFLSGRVETQSELLRILNALQGSGRQIVMTCDRAPSEIADVDQRLLSRLAGGLIVDVGAPDAETRREILERTCTERGVSFLPGVLDEVARPPVTSVRELQGCLNRLLAHQSLTEAPISVADVWHVTGSARLASGPAPDEFEHFLADLAATVAESVDTWRVRLGERIAVWSGDGFRTDRLERELTRRDPPDVEALVAAFAADAERLRALEGEAVRLDPRSAGMAIFRDPERLAEAEEYVARTLARREPLPGPRPGYRLHDLVRTARNRVAIQAASAVVASPGGHYNPLVLHGPSGSGKSHLAHAVGNALRARGDGVLAVACLTGTEWVAEIARAEETGTLERWRTRCRGADVLVIDDLQGLAGAARAQDELFHLFDTWQRAGRQLVVTADRPPAQLAGIEARLRTRLEAGLVAELGVVDGVDRWGRYTPVPVGDEAAAPTIDADLDEALAGVLGEDATGDVALPGGAGEPLDFAALAREPQALDSFFFDAEKVVADWPGVEGRIIEELR